MRGRWKKFRYRYEWVCLVLATKIVPLLPRRVCYHFANVVGGLFAKFDTAGRKVARSNLEVVFGKTLSFNQREQIAEQSYRHLARTMLDLLWSPRLTKQNFQRWFEVKGLREAMAEINPKQSCIFITIHYGNFEWAAKAMGLCDFPLLILAQEFKNPMLDPIVADLRRPPSHEIAPREGAIIRMYKALRRGKHVAILSDLTLRPTQPSVAVDYFGLKTCVAYAHAWLHKKTGAPIIPLHCDQLPGGRCRLVVQRKLEMPDADETEIAQACWDRFEPIIRENPAPWLWMYKQWRYKPSQTDRAYPFYSNTSYYFDQLLVRDLEEMKEIRATYAAAPAPS